MDRRSVFFDEWLRSLREQYKHVVRKGDGVTLPTLTAVMHDVGFGEDELAQLRLEATMHVDDVGADFAADMNILDQPLAGRPHPAECLCPECATIDESQFDADGQPIVPDPDEASYESGHVFPTAPLADSDPAENAEPLTFEDSVTADVDTEPDQEDPAAESAESEIDGSEDDPDAPEQMSLF